MIIEAICGIEQPDDLPEAQDFGYLTGFEDVAHVFHRLGAIQGQVEEELHNSYSMGVLLRRLVLSGIAVVCLLVAAVSAQEQPPPVAPVTEPVQEVNATTPVLSEEPKPQRERPTVWGEPTKVEILLYMIDLDEVNSSEQNFAASVYYEARWQNSLLVHEGPGPIHRGVTEIWTPRLVVVNQQMAWPAFPGSVEIYPNGEVVYRQKVWG